MVVLVLLSGCSSSTDDIQPVSSARALLDYDTGDIIMPLSEYSLYGTNDDVETRNMAARLAISRCMSAEGFDYPSNVPNDLDRVLENRRYGLWLVSSARIYGSHDQPSNVDQQLAELAAAGGPAWLDAEQSCVSQTVNSGDMADLFATPEQDGQSLVAELDTQAYRAAVADPAWQAAREAWWSCLEGAGLEPDRGDEMWSSMQGEQAFLDSGEVPSAEEIRVSFLEAQCNIEVSLTQNLGNLEASYQAALIEKNQAALNEEKDLKNRLRNNQLEYIAQFG